MYVHMAVCEFVFLLKWQLNHKALGEQSTSISCRFSEELMLRKQIKILTPYIQILTPHYSYTCSRQV